MTTNRNNSYAMNLQRPGHQVLMAYGPIWEIKQFLSPIEFTKMQQLNKYCYNIAVGRS